MPEIKKTKKSQKISAKRVVYIDIDDEISEIIDKVCANKASRVFLVAPRQATLFQSLVNLKIVKQEAKKRKKTIYLITDDINGINLAAQAKIKVYDKVTDDRSVFLFSSKTEDEQLKITPLRASINALEEHAPTRITERKLSISELLKKGKKKIKPERAKKNKFSLPDFQIKTPNKWPLIALLGLTFVILVSVFYIALPGATIYLTPKASVLEKKANITLADYNKNRAELETRPKHMLASYPVEVSSALTITQDSTGKTVSEKGANASGKLTIFNTETYEWPLVADTRFQNKDGIVFRIKEPVRVPAKGQLEVGVFADPLDAYEMIVGERGNIGPDKFFLPGLRESNREKLYAESFEAMTGGVTDFTAFVSGDDIEAAKVRLKDELTRKALEDLREKVREQGENFVLLEESGMLQIGEPKYEIAEGLEGSLVAKFEISGSLSGSGIYYDREAMLEILKGELILIKSPNKELLRINEKSTTFRIFEKDLGAGKIKLTANIKGVEQFDINPKSENGRKLLQKIREHIAGKEIETAKSFIRLLPEIDRVEIESWPYWAPTIPKLTENIKFDVREARVVQ